jgi:hypothetical protein
VPLSSYHGFDLPVQLHDKTNIDFDPTKNWPGAPSDFATQFTALWNVK